MTERKESQFAKLGMKTDRPAQGGTGTGTGDRRGFKSGGQRGEGNFGRSQDRPQGSQGGDRNYSRPNGQQGDRKPRDGNNFKGGNGGNNFNKDNKNNHKERTQVGECWIETSEHTRYNKRTKKCMWKEEYWTNEVPNVCMRELKLGRSGDRMYVPSTWVFQNVIGGHFECKCGSTFVQECSLHLHTKACQSC